MYVSGKSSPTQFLYKYGDRKEILNIRMIPDNLFLKKATSAK